MVPGALSPQKFNLVELFFETGESETMAVNEYIVRTIEDAFDMAFDTLQTTAKRDPKGVRMLNQVFGTTGTFNFAVGDITSESILVARNDLTELKDDLQAMIDLFPELAENQEYLQESGVGSAMRNLEILERTNLSFAWIVTGKLK